MSQRNIVTEVIIDDDARFTFSEVCQYCHFSEQMLNDLIDHGLFGEIEPPYQKIQFDHVMLSRARSAFRLRRDFELDLQGILLVLELLDEMTNLREELEVLRKNVREIE